MPKARIAFVSMRGLTRFAGGLATLGSTPQAPADAHSVFLSALTFGWVDAQHVHIALATLFGLMVEVGATVGLFAALSHPSKKPATALACGRWRPRIG